MTTLTIPQTTTEELGPFTRTIFPDGTSVVFRESNHSYWSDCKSKTAKGEQVWSGTAPRLAGVSTVVSPYDFRPDSLMKWAAELDHVGVARVFGGRECPSDPADIRSALWANKVTWQQARDEKADTGKAAHEKVLHQLALGNEPDLNVLLPHERGFGQAIYRWVVDREPEFIHAEQVVASLDNGVAGTLDLRVRLNNSRIGLDIRDGIAVIDAKARGFIPASSLAQVAGYDKCVVDCGLGEPADHLMILKLLDDGTYREIWVDQDKTPEQRHEGFLAGLRVYRQAAEYMKQTQAALR